MREVKISMENEKPEQKLIHITKDPHYYYCRVTLPDEQLIKFHAKGWQTLLNQLGHILIAMTPDIERGRYASVV